MLFVWACVCVCAYVPGAIRENITITIPTTNHNQDFNIQIPQTPQPQHHGFMITLVVLLCRGGAPDLQRVYSICA
jgi:hypothetical protein